MKHSIRLLALSLAVVSAASAAPFLAAGDGAELFLTGTLGVRSDDNIFLSNSKTSDVIFDINPGVDFVFGKGSLTQGNFSIVESIARYSQNGDLDTELAAVNFSSKYDDGKTKFTAKAGYNELNQNTATIQKLTRRDVLSASLNGETSVSAKSKIGAGFVYKDTNYKPVTYSDLTTYEIPVNYYYAVTSKVDLSFGLRYRKSEVHIGSDSKGYTYRIGARGEFTPKVTGSVAVGYGQRDLDSGGNKSLIDLDANLNVALSPKSTLRLMASNDFSNSAQGQEQKKLTLGGTVISKISDQLSTRVGFTYQSINYYTRTDGYFEGKLGADYVISNNVTVSGGYTYRNNDSELVGGDFNNNVFSLSAKFRY